MSSTAQCNADYTVEERLARWLLMCHDRADGDEIAITHDHMALMLSVRRPGVTVATHMLEGEGIIRARRGLITIIDREKLKGRANGSYGMAEAEYERLIGSVASGERSNVVQFPPGAVVGQEARDQALAPLIRSSKRGLLRSSVEPYARREL